MLQKISLPIVFLSVALTTTLHCLLLQNASAGSKQPVLISNGYDLDNHDEALVINEYDAGYQWAKANHISNFKDCNDPDDSISLPQSFMYGCRAGAKEVQNADK